MNVKNSPGELHLHIDALVLQGFTRINTGAFTMALQEALTAELSTLMSARDDINLSRAQAAVTLPHEAGAADVSTALVQALADIVKGADVATSASAGARHD